MGLHNLLQKLVKNSVAQNAVLCVIESGNNLCGNLFIFLWKDHIICVEVMYVLVPLMGLTTKPGWKGKDLSDDMFWMI
jgi:hypothetical protein